jgi:hypothetical protein
MYDESQAPAAAAPARNVGSVAITRLVPAPSGLATAATGCYEAGVGRVDFVLVDLAGDPTDVVDRKDVEYAKPPTRVGEAWESSVALTPERAYRLFVHVYDQTGVNLVAYDRRDFVCERNEPEGGDAPWGEQGTISSV